MQILQLFRHEKKTPAGDSLDDLRKQSNKVLEDRHDYIQFMFPSIETSQFNRTAPVVTEGVAAAFRQDENMSHELLLNLRRICIFWDFSIKEEHDKILFSLKPEFFSKRAKEVIFRNSSKFHNFLRVTRVIKSLYTLGLEPYAYALKKFVINDLKDTIKVPLTTVKFWEDSIPNPTHFSEAQEIEQINVKRKGVSPSKETKRQRCILPKALKQIVEQTQCRMTWSLHEALQHLVSKEPRFLDVATQHGIPKLYCSDTAHSELVNGDYFVSLLKTIVYQQLAGNVAENIFEKVKTCLLLENQSGKNRGEKFLKLTPECVRDAIITVKFDEKGKKKVLINGQESGLSEAKAKYMKSLSEHFLDDSKLRGADLQSLSDEDLCSKLQAVNGLGLWSVHMFMIFKLYRPNVLAIGDLGIRAGLCSFYGLPKGSLEGSNKDDTIRKLCNNWAPYSSLGCCFMWTVADYEKSMKPSVIRR